MKKYEFLPQNQNKILKFRFLIISYASAKIFNGFFWCFRHQQQNLKYTFSKKKFKIPRVDFFSIVFKQILLAKMFIRFPWTWHQKIQLIFFYFQMIRSILRNVNYLFDFLKKSKNLIFQKKNFYTENFQSKIVIYFFSGYIFSG